MKKILALALFLVTMLVSVCSAQMQKSYDEKNSYAMIKAMNAAPATELDPESLIIVNIQKRYIFDSKGYDAATGRYNPEMYFTIAIMGNAAEKFEPVLNYTVGRSHYTLPMKVTSKQNEKRQTVLASGTCSFIQQEAPEKFIQALKEDQPIALTITMKAKKNNILNYTIDGNVLKDMQDVVLYDIYSDDNFLNIAKKASQKPRF